jgi:hypothetical protein
MAILSNQSIANHPTLTWQSTQYAQQIALLLAATM